MKRFDLVQYFELAEGLSRASAVYSAATAKGYDLFFSASGLPEKLNRMVAEDNDLQASKHIASELSAAIRAFINTHLMTDVKFDPTNLDSEFPSWKYINVSNAITALRTVYLAECRDIEVYSVGQISIYKLSHLVSSASTRIASELRKDVPQEALDEFDEAGRCLAFQLPTACGFHALRGLELMMGAYLRKFEPEASPKSWFDYIKAFQKLSEGTKGGLKPSPKVVAMLDRMRVLDRNPLMHPQDRLDTSAADMLFNLAAITVSEMARDISTRDVQAELPLEPAEEVLALPAAKAAE